jgi:putative ABC transport system permease protein
VRAIVGAILIALRAIRRNVLRASLTVLGILIGVAAVVTVTALGSGARENVSSQIQSIGSNFIIIWPERALASGARTANGTGPRLSEEDGLAIKREDVSVVAISPVLGARTQIVSGDRNWSTWAQGVTLDYFQVRNWNLGRGSFWTVSDEEQKSKVCVIGATLQKELFGGTDPIGKSVRIGRYPYTIIGVLEKKGQSPFGDDQDDNLLMPIGSMRARVLHTAPGFAGVLMLSASSPETTDRAVKQADSILRQRHHIDQGAQPDYQIRTLKEFQEMQAKVYGLLTIVLIGVAGISLLVGGIGVMNIMLVSVTERTREIGIRMAIGAREADIRRQFLTEAIVLALLGGIAGAIIGVGAIAGLGALLEWPMKLSPTALTVAVATSAITGVVFGFFPAHRASKLDPILALHHE